MGSLLRATTTPLASIFGSGFLVIVPILNGAVGPWASVAMAAVCALAYAVGGVIRFNIRHVEPVLAGADAPHRLRMLERSSDAALVLAYVVSVCLYVNILAAFLLGGIGEAWDTPRNEHLLSAIVIAGLTSWIGAEGALLAVGLGTPAIALLMARSLATVDRETVPPDPARIDALLATPMFEPLALPVIEQLALNMTGRQLPTGETLITQGDLADNLYLVATGELEVSRRGEVVAVLRAGAHVGEVGLLRGKPRNATVVAGEPTSTWAIDGSVFLEAVTGHPRSLDTAESVTAARDTDT